MNILIIGNLGYIGPVISRTLRKNENINLIGGFDIGYFAHLLSGEEIFPEKGINVQHFGDVRKFPKKILDQYNIVIYMAAISNDPMGNLFEKPTYDINTEAAINIAQLSKQSGVNKFIFASSCSVYGTDDNSKAKTENSQLNPLTPYAKSKIKTEEKLKTLADKNFQITCLRFATACGFSPRMRLDLVLNDFVASAITSKKIKILSDGSPWRPLIHVKDMSRAIEWSCVRKNSPHTNFLVLNAGSNDWNYQVKELAYAVKDEIGNIEISINQNAQIDKRSYKVNFDKFKELSKNYYPRVDLKEAVKDIADNLSNVNFDEINFRESSFMRLKILENHIINKRLNKNLEWQK